MTEGKRKTHPASYRTSSMNDRPTKNPSIGEVPIGGSQRNSPIQPAIGGACQPPHENGHVAAAVELAPDPSIGFPRDRSTYPT